MGSSRNWDLEIDPSVFQELKKIPRHYTEGILRIVKLLPDDPYYGDIRKMKGKENIWRRRIGVYRIFYKINVREKVILVFRLERRTSRTY